MQAISWSRPNGTGTAALADHGSFWRIIEMPTRARVRRLRIFGQRDKLKATVRPTPARPSAMIEAVTHKGLRVVMEFADNGVRGAKGRTSARL